MPLLESVLAAVGIAGAKFLAKKSIAAAAQATGLLDGEVAGEMSGGVMDWFKDQVKDEAARKKLTRPFEDLPRTIVQKLKPLFQKEQQRRTRDTKLPKLDSKAVVKQLCLTLEDWTSLEFFLAGNLDAARVTEQLRGVRPLGRKTLSTADTQFYHHVLERFVPVLIELSAKLPEFPVVIARELLNRSDRVEGKVTAIQQTLDAKDAQAEAERAEFERRYRDAVKAKNNHLELFGADISPEAVELPLSVAYVSLNLQSTDNPDGSGLRSAEALFDDLRPEAGRLLIRGEAGMGKSTLLRWAAMNAADKQYTVDRVFRGRVNIRMAIKQWWSLRIPFLIRLRDCSEGRIPGPDQLLELIAKELGTPPKNWVVDLLTAGKAMILLDGVDEVRGDFRANHFLVDLKNLVNAYPKNYFVVSTRPEAVPKDWLQKLEFREARINPMSENDKRQFIDKWHEAVGQKPAVRVGTTPEKPLAEDLKEKLMANPAISRLATNPLMCAMICALHRGRQRQLPGSQSELVEALCEMLLHRRDAESDLKGDRFAGPYADLTYRQKKWIVQDLAYDMMVLKGESVIARDVAEPLVAERLQRLGKPSDEAAVVLQSLVERSGMLREATPKTVDSPGTLDFVHNTFKEYLTGIRLAKDGAVKTVVDNSANPDWLQVVLFAVATEEDGFATKIVTKILGDDYQPDKKVGRTLKPKGERRKKLTPSELEVQQRLLLALRCLPVALDLDPKLRAWLEKQLGRMFPPRSMVEAEALATTGDLAVPFLKNQGGVQKMAASVRALRLIGTETAVTTLRGYLQETSLDVLEELSQAPEINPLEIPAVQRMVQEPYCYEKFQKGRSIRSQIVDLSPLKGLSGLTTLDLNDTNVSDLSPLADLNGLTTLHLKRTRVSNLSPLAGLSGLTTLALFGTSVSDLSPLAGLSGLTTLDLYGTKVSDLSPLAGLSGLTTLDLCCTTVSDLSPLARLCDLRTLNLTSAWVTDLSPLTKLSGLTTLDLGDTGVSDLSPLAGLNGLTTLILYGTEVRDLSPLAGLSGLTSINIYATPVTDLSPLTGLKKLREIELHREQNVKVPASLEHAIR